MKKILSDIYHGNYTSFNKRNRKGTPFAITLDRINELEAEIRKALPDEVQETFDQFLCAQSELSNLMCEEDFETGYQLGVQMVLAGLNENEEIVFKNHAGE